LNEYQVVCINKGDRADPHTAIEKIGMLVGSATRVIPQQTVVEDLEANRYRLYTLVDGVRARVIVARHNGRKYLKTQADGVWPNNLLALAECKR